MPVLDEADIRQAHRDGDYRRAATLTLERYEGEVYSFLVANLRRDSDAHEVFSQLSEDLWTGLPGFAWRCSVRTWIYTLARNAVHRFRRTPANDPARRVPMSQAPERVVQPRSSTAPFRRTAIKDRLAELRQDLDPDDQALLILRLDRQLPWDEVARILNDAAHADDATVKQLATNLRQRYRKVKDRIATMARASGLLDAAD